MYIITLLNFQSIFFFLEGFKQRLLLFLMVGLVGELLDRRCFLGVHWLENYFGDLGAVGYVDLGGSVYFRVDLHF